jgi:3-phosphoshikimate 1-carboxyvinyltransferase
MFKEPDKDTLPITLRGNKIPLPLTYQSPVSSAQIKSCILLSGLSSLGKTTGYRTIFIQRSYGTDVKVSRS